MVPAFVMNAILGAITILQRMTCAQTVETSFGFSLHPRGGSRDKTDCRTAQETYQ